MAFQKAVKHESKLRLAITGPSGSGKTYTALAVASVLADGKRIAVVDTEHGSAAKYADAFDFDVENMQPPYHPDRFISFIREAAAAGYGVIILDSLTHAWQGTGGMLDLVDEIAKRKTGGNGFAAWKDATPIQNRMIEAIVGANIHIIATMRSKQDYVQDKDDRGKTQIRKVGMAAQQREGFEYEFDVVLDMDIDHNGIVSKTRASVIADRVFNKPGAEFAGLLKEWLKGAPEKVEQKEVQEEAKQEAGTLAGAATTSGTDGSGKLGYDNGAAAVSPAWKSWTTVEQLFTFAVDNGHFADKDAARIQFATFVKEFGGYRTTTKAKVHETWWALYKDAVEDDADQDEDFYSETVDGEAVEVPAF